MLCSQSPQITSLNVALLKYLSRTIKAFAFGHGLLQLPPQLLFVPRDSHSQLHAAGGGVRQNVLLALHVYVEGLEALDGKPPPAGHELQVTLQILGSELLEHLEQPNHLVRAPVAVLVRGVAHVLIDVESVALAH